MFTEFIIHWQFTLAMLFLCGGILGAVAYGFQRQGLDKQNRNLRQQAANAREWREQFANWLGDVYGLNRQMRENTPSWVSRQPLEGQLGASASITVTYLGDGGLRIIVKTQSNNWVEKRFDVDRSIFRDATERYTLGYFQCLTQEINLWVNTTMSLLDNSY